MAQLIDDAVFIVTIKVNDNTHNTAVNITNCCIPEMITKVMYIPTPTASHYYIQLKKKKIVEEELNCIMIIKEKLTLTILFEQST